MCPLPFFWSFSHPGSEQKWTVACYLGRWQLTLENKPANSQMVAAAPLPWELEAATWWHLACTVWVCYLWYTHEQRFWQSWSQLCTYKPRHSTMKAYAHLFDTPPLPKLLCILTQDPSPTIMSSSQVFGQWTPASGQNLLMNNPCQNKELCSLGKWCWRTCWDSLSSPIGRGCKSAEDVNPTDKYLYNIIDRCSPRSLWKKTTQ